MSNLEVKRKIFTSAPFYFVITGLPFGLFQGSVNGPHQHGYSWSGAIVSGAIFGGSMTIIFKSNLRKAGRATGFDDPAKQQIMYKAIKTGKLPTDSEALEALPAYIEYRLRQGQKSQKISYILIASIGLINLYFAIADRDIVLTVLSIFILSIIPMSHRSIHKQAQRVVALRAKLDTINDNK